MGRSDIRWWKGDEGIALVLIGVMLAVLLALAGMAVDLGVVYGERRELRTGADAAALAIAEDCGRGTRPCDAATALATAEEYADANSWDAASAVESVDLTFTGAGSGSVRVVTSAWDAAAGEAGVRVPLLSLLGFHRVDVGAAATAIFDYPSSGEGLPLIIDWCEWNIFYEAGEVTLTFHAPSSTDPEPTDCPADPAHKDFPGAFGWILPNEGVCGASVDTGALVPADTGNNVPQNCDPAWLEENLLNHEILIPVFDEFYSHEKEYHVAGFGSFQVTGYKLSSGSKYTQPAGFTCGGSPADTCLRGYFTEDTLTTGDPGGEDYGVVLVKLVE